MKRFFGLVQKEWFHIIRDKRSLLILLGMPIVQILIFGFAITNELREAKIAILDHAHDSYSRQLIQEITANEYFVLAKNLHTESEIEPAMQANEIKAALVIEPSFEENMVREKMGTLQLITDASDPNMARTITNYLVAIIRNFQQSKAEGAAIPYTIQPEVRMYFNPELKSVFMFVPGIMTIILMLVSAMMTSISIAREKELGTMEVLLASSLKPTIVVLGKVVPYILLSLLNAVVILLLGFFVFQMPMTGNWLLLSGQLLLFILTALSLGILISTVSNSQQTAMMISLAGLMLPTIMLSGFIFPISSMPEVLQWASHIIPARWFITILKGVMLKGVGLDILWKETLILAAMTTFFLLVSIKRYKIRLQ